jgi:hypothetical protein
MSEQEDIGRFDVRLSGVESKIEKLTLAIQGNEILGIYGIVQHMNEMQKALREIAHDVRDLKDDKKTIKGWIAGLAAAGGIGGFIGNWLSK